MLEPAPVGFEQFGWFQSRVAMFQTQPLQLLRPWGGVGDVSALRKWIGERALKIEKKSETRKVERIELWSYGKWCSGFRKKRIEWKQLQLQRPFWREPSSLSHHSHPHLYPLVFLSIYSYNGRFYLFIFYYCTILTFYHFFRLKSFYFTPGKFKKTSIESKNSVFIIFYEYEFFFFFLNNTSMNSDFISLFLLIL